MKTIALFGATGSIGQSTLDILRARPQDFKVRVLSAHSQWQKLAELAIEFSAETVVIADKTRFSDLKNALAGYPVHVMAGEDALVEASKIGVDLYIAAIVGIAGLAPVFAAVRAGNTIALANKEALVCAGNLLLEEARRNNVSILPLDSEHNAIFQVFEQTQRHALSKVILTASGGPFREKSREELKSVTVNQALKHPNWSMGAKISIDSATMANKALEMMEAVHLFNLQPHELEVVIHPQSIIHSMVEYMDGSVLAQLGAPDMKTPIGYALNWPERGAAPSEKLDFTKTLDFNMYPIDKKRFYTVKLMHDIIRDNHQAAIIFNAANEIAVEAFLKQQIAFLEIESIIQACLDGIQAGHIENIENVFDLDLETRRYAHDIITINSKSCGLSS